MDFLCEFRFEFILLIDVDIGILDSIENTVGDLRIVKVEYLFTAILIIQRNGGTVLHGPFEIVNGDIAAEGPGRNIIAGEKRRACKTDTSRCREQLHHIIGKDPVLAAVRFVRHDDNIVVRVNRLLVRSVEFLYQCEYEARIAFQLCNKVAAACGYKL